MCLIIYKPTAEAEIPQHYIDNAARINPDGFGITYLDDGKTHKTMDYKKARKFIEAKRPFVAHYRYKTVGKVARRNCHPFNVSRNEVLYSNGTVKTLGDVDKPDTKVIAEYLRFLPTKKQRKALLSMTDTRFAYIDTKEGTVEMHGKWHERQGVWFSKDNCFYKPVQPTVKKPANGKPWASGEADWWYNQHDNDPYIHKPYYDQHGGWHATREAANKAKARKEAICKTNEAKSKKAKNSLPAKTVQHNKTWNTYESWRGNMLVAVYGTLKQGFSNDQFMREGEFIAHGWTENSYRLECHGIPYLFEDPIGVNGRDYSPVAVEVYRVFSYKAREAIDRLEGHPNHYERKQIKVWCDDNKYRTCWIYFAAAAEPDLNREHHMEWFPQYRREFGQQEESTGSELGPYLNPDWEAIQERLDAEFGEEMADYLIESGQSESALKALDQLDREDV